MRLLLQCIGNAIEYQPFPGAPVRCQQYPWCSRGGYPVKNDFRWCLADKCGCYCYVFVQQQWLIFSAAPFISQLRTLHDMQRMQFQSVHAKFQHPVQGDLAMCFRFAGQADDKMCAYLQATPAGIENR